MEFCCRATAFLGYLARSMGLSDWVKLEVLADKKTPEQRLVVIRSEPDTPYQRWISITGKIEKAGGVIVIDVAGEDDE